MSAAPAVAPEDAETAERIASAGHVTVTLFGPALGAAIGGLDLARPLTAAELGAVRAQATAGKVRPLTGP